MDLLQEISLRVRYRLIASASCETHELPQLQCYFNTMLSSIPSGLRIVVLVYPKGYTEDWPLRLLQGLYGLSAASDIDLWRLVSLIEL